MTFYVIAKPDEQFLNSPVFYAGTDGAEEAVAVFTSHRLAQKYIDAAEWQGVETVVTLQPLEMIRWLLAADDGGSTILAVDPRYDSHSSLPQPTLSIPELLGEFAEAVGDRIQAPAPPARSHIIAMDMLHCQKCGKLIEQRTGGPPRKCCGETMDVAASNAFESFAAVD